MRNQEKEETEEKREQEETERNGTIATHSSVYSEVALRCSAI